jgi:squalene-hopene/tetraprenyl-beta-curcumene cyclase
VGPEESILRRAKAFLRARQAGDGTWYGRWGCNYLYGTWLAVRGLAQVGEDMTQERYQRVAAWLDGHQNADGGWGELPASYDDPDRKGIGPTTASQTSWALLALFALGGEDSPSARRGLDYLLRTQLPDGSWRDDYWTGTGFPKVFYLRYHLYAVYSPLLALGIYRARSKGGARPARALAEVGA